MDTTSNGTTTNPSLIYTAKDNPGPSTKTTTGTQYTTNTATTTNTPYTVITTLNYPMGTLHDGYYITVDYETTITTGNEVLQFIVYEDDIQVTTNDELIITHDTSNTIGRCTIAARFDRNKKYSIEIRSRDITGYNLTIDLIQLHSFRTTLDTNEERCLTLTDQGTTSIPANATAESSFTITYNYTFTEAPLVQITSSAANYNVSYVNTTKTTTGCTGIVRTLTGAAVGSGQYADWRVTGTVGLPCVI